MQTNSSNIAKSSPCSSRTMPGTVGGDPRQERPSHTFSSSVVLTFKSSEKQHFNAVETADILGISDDYLAILAGTQEIFRPAAKYARKAIYPRKQIQIISLVMRDKLTPEQGAELWRRIQDRELADVLRDARGEDIAPRRRARKQ